MRDAQRLLGAKGKRLVGTVIGAAVTAFVLSLVATPSTASAAPLSASGPGLATTPLAATPSASSLQQQITQQSSALEKIVEQYNGVSEQLKANQAKEKKLDADIAPTLAKLSTARASINEIISQAYMTGPVGSLTALVSSHDTSDLLDQMTAMDQIASSQVKDVNQYVALQNQYNSQRQQLNGLITLQTAQQKNLAAQRTSINTQLAKLYKLRTEAYGRATEKASTSTAAPPKYLAGRGGAVVKFAYAQLGKPYAWGADGPGSYDCSGLTLAAYRTVGVTLYHEASVQWTETHRLTRSQLQPGDLVFYSNLGHVAIYIGNNKVIHAPTFGEVVKISSIDMMPPYGYGRP